MRTQPGRENPQPSLPLRTASGALLLLAAVLLMRGAFGVGAAWGDDTVAVAAEETSPPAKPAPDRSKAFGHLETGKDLYESTCMPCHGPNAEGNRDIGAPALNRQEPWYLLAQLRKFRSGMRGTKDDDLGGQMMAPMAMSLADEQALLDVATYVASLVGEAPPATLRGDRVAGQRTFRTICAPCHGSDGAGRPEIRTPALGGQADWYVISQLRKFRRGIRGYHEQDIAGMQMRGMSTALANDQALVDVAVYVTSLSK